MVNPDIAEYIRQNRQNNIPDQDITSALQSAGWDSQSIQDSFNFLTTSKQSSPAGIKFNLKILIGVILILVVVGYGAFSYAKGLFPFSSSAPYNGQNIYGAADKAASIKSASYVIAGTLKSEPRTDADLSMWETIPELKEKKAQFDRDMQRYDDMNKIRSSLSTNYGYKNKLYPNTLAEANLPVQDSQGKPYQYTLINNGHDYSLTINFEIGLTKEDYSYPINTRSTPTKVKTVTITSGAYQYFFMDPQPNLPGIASIFGARSSYLDGVRGNVDISASLGGDFSRTKDLGDSHTQIKVNLEFGGLIIKGDLEFLKKDENVYAKINSFPALFFDVSSVQGKWIQFTPQDLTDNSYTALFSGWLASSSNSQSNEALNSVNKFFKIANEESAVIVKNGPTREAINGQTAYRYSLAFDKNKFPQFYARIGTELDQFKNNSLIKFDKESLDYLKSSEFSAIFDYLSKHSSLDVWVNKDGYPIRLSYSYTYVPSKDASVGSDQKFTLAGSIDLSNINGKFDYSVPSNYLKYQDVQQIFTGETKEEYQQDQKDNPGDAQSRARDARRVVDVNQLRTVAELYFDDNGGHYPTNLNFDTIKKYMTVSSVPTDPTTGNPYYYAYNPAINPQHFIVWTELENKNKSSLENDSDIDASGWSGNAINAKAASTESCSSVYNKGAARDCVFDQGY